MEEVARAKATQKSPKREIVDYEHTDKTRKNNPPVGLVDPDSDPFNGRTKYAYDPHLDPQLGWAGKAERTSFEVPKVSLHVHERIEPTTIIESVRRRDGGSRQLSLFESIDRKTPLREAIEFYKHENEWTNRLIAGDSLLVMNSLLQKEGLAGRVQMVYLDPPYGIKYGSNFQPFVNRRDVKDARDEDLTQEPEMVKAFRDTWELGIHSYLSYIRDRLLLSRDLLSESGSCFVQISDENIHLVRCVLDEVFGSANFVSVISFSTTSGFESRALPRAGDYLLWYAKDRSKMKFHQLFLAAERSPGDGGYRWIQTPDGKNRSLTAEELRGEKPMPKGARLYIPDNMISQGAASSSQPFEFGGKTYLPPANSHWKASYPEGLQRLAQANRIHTSENSLRYVRFADDFPYKDFTNLWTDTLTGQFTEPKVYVVQTNTKIVARCVLMTTDPGDLVFDPTCGSGTTASTAEAWGRRWISCDTSRVAVAIAKQRLMTAIYPYYQLAHADEGIRSGFRYETVPHVTLRSLATGERPHVETLHDRPVTDEQRVRVSGPFTVEAVPAPAVIALGNEATLKSADASAPRLGATAKVGEWTSELQQTGIRARAGHRIGFTRIETSAGLRWIHATGETREEKPQTAAFSFGPDYAPLEQRHVLLALEEAKSLVPKPKLVIFCAFQFDPEAAKDIDEANWPGVTLLKVQMNTDLLTDDLKKKRSSNESFLLIGQPDVRLIREKGGYKVEVLGFDYYNTKTGAVESGGTDRIAMWLLDTDYDGRSLFPRQVFFPMADENGGWARLARNLKAEIDEEKISTFRGTVSLPFEIGQYRRVAVKIVDDRGIESLKIVNLE